MEKFACDNCKKKFAEKDMMFNHTSGNGICDDCFDLADNEDREYYNNEYIQQ